MKIERHKLESLFQAYLDGTICEGDRKLLLDFIRHDPGLNVWFETQIEKEQETIDPEASRRMLAEIHKAIDLEKRQLGALRRRSLLLKASRVAAVILLPVVAVLATWRIMRVDEVQEPVTVSVERGQKASVVLPDGSKVWLNSQSVLTYTPDFRGRERNVSLTGEAYFEVRPDKSRPFTVGAGAMEVKVLGTSFNVRAYPEDGMLTSTLVDGRVEVSTPDGHYTLSPNQQIDYDVAGGKTLLPRSVEATDFTGWINNTLRFVDQPLEQIVLTVERMYNVDVEFATEGIKSRRFSGTLPNTSLESILEVISISSPIVYTVTDSTIYLSEDTRRRQFYQ